MKLLIFVFIICSTAFSSKYLPENVKMEYDPQLKILRIINDSKISYFEKLRTLRSYGDDVLPVLKKIYKDENVSFASRWMSVMFYARVGGRKKAFNGLKEALGDRQWFIRSASAKALGYMKIKESVPLLIELLINDKALPVRTSAVNSLGQIGSRKAVQPLIKALHDPQNFYRGQSLWIRRHIVQALMEIGDPYVINSLIVLLDDSDKKVVKASLEALSRITGRKHHGINDDQLIARWKSWFVKDGKFESGNVSVSFISKKENQKEKNQ